ncbi:hypothetical protein A1O1_05416 [Capronia coronata CBS 617.96]|uniref:Secreted protein n=1 Tax=Capronia coronata CBS 617.96 TaxID=1182541 RepID=W9YGV0_9EURO|nr:uncharacterized protein A1O1_05416 [Capronia coronata CBS 617.96]EXJ88486.1 hypothetical protein A1O1_05416 [Capronia coronata CBS 617.96]
MAEQPQNYNYAPSAQDQNSAPPGNTIASTQPAASLSANMSSFGQQGQDQPQGAGNSYPVPPPPPPPPRPHQGQGTSSPIPLPVRPDTGPAPVEHAYEPPPPPLPQRPRGSLDVKGQNLLQQPQPHGDHLSEYAQQYPPSQPPAYTQQPSSYQPATTDQPPFQPNPQSQFQPGQPPFQSNLQSQFQPPPQRHKQTFADNDDPSNPIHYIRDPHKLIGYLVPFPQPDLPNVKPEDIPVRFMIYTPPPPPLQKPAEGQKEGKLHKVQRKWQEEVRSAKTSTAKTASWQGVKSKATKGISWAMNKTTSSNLDFLGRVSPAHSEDDGEDQQTQTHKTVGVDEMILVYPPSMPLNDQQMREEFVNTMLRTKSKAQRDTIIATGLMPVGYGIDILATFIWPFGGLGEIDTVWAYASFRGAKTARSVTKRLSSSTSGSGTGNHGQDDQLKLTFTHSARIEVLKRYLDAECHKVDAKLFPTYTSRPTETDVLEVIGWTPSDRGGADQEDKNWEDEQWEMAEVKDDLRSVFSKGAREWRKWCLLLEKNPEKAMKK